MGDGGSLIDVLMLSLPLAVIGGVLLALDGMKKEFETRAFFGMMCVVWAGLMVGHHFNGRDGSGYGKNQNISQTEASTDAAQPAEQAINPAHEITLELDEQAAAGDDGINLLGMETRLSINCSGRMTILISSKQVLPSTLQVTMAAPNLEPSTRLTVDTYDVDQGDYITRYMPMDVFCDRLDNATIVVEGLKSQPIQAGASASNKITVQLSKK